MTEYLLFVKLGHFVQYLFLSVQSNPAMGNSHGSLGTSTLKSHVIVFRIILILKIQRQ